MTGVTSWYRSDMFRRHTTAERNIALRNYWLQVRARGRNRFIWGEIRASLFFGSVIFLLTQIVVDGAHTIFSRSFVVAGLSLLLIFGLGGYLEGKWKWQDLEKNYPE